MAVPEKLRAGGVQNYGFHGLSYQYIASQLGPKSGRWVVLHLGSGASACALLNGVSLGTSMGFSALDGLVMGTRPGRIDPGAVLHWWQQGFSHDELVQALYQQSGLQGLAGESDMRVLLGRNDPDALHAVEHFCLSAARAVGDMAVILGGIDGLVLTGGIGENSKTIRDDIAQRVQFLTREIRVIKTDEEGVIARAVLDQIRGSDSVH